MSDFNVGYNRALIDVRNKVLFDKNTRDGALERGRKVGPQGESIEDYDERMARLRTERDLLDSYASTIERMLKEV